MSNNAHVNKLVHGAAPLKHAIQGVLGHCLKMGKKHTYTVVVGGPGSQKENIGLVLDTISTLSLPLGWTIYSTSSQLLHSKWKCTNVSITLPCACKWH